MSSVWVCIPSARPPEVVAEWAKAWRERGYNIALWRESSDFPYGVVDYLRNEPVYPGYANAVNALIHDVMLSTDQHGGGMKPQAEWFIIGGDDVFPDLDHSAEEIAKQCGDYFADPDGRHGDWANRIFLDQHRTFGVMQPTGDDWGSNPNHPNPAMRGSYISRVCGSAWIGREFATRVNQGKGPLWPEYHHMFVDEELQHVATKLGVLWQRPDLTQMHQHEARKHRSYTSADIPPHLKKWAGPEHWKEAEAIFKGRRAAGFPGSEPL
jgi:hypothetical protein